MNALEKLYDELGVCGCDPDECLGCDVPRKVREGLQAVEREYMELPKDVDGVPIRVGDSLVHADGWPVEPEAVDAHGVIAWDGRDFVHVGGDECRHVKQRTLFDVLSEVENGELSICAAEREVRELTGVGE